TQTLANNESSLPNITLAKSQTYTKLTPEYFRATMNGDAKPQYPIQVKLKYVQGDKTPQNDSIQIDFSILNAPYVLNNQYTEDKSSMYNQDAFEVYMSPCDQKEKNNTNCITPNRYIELEINPNGAVFSGFIDNPNYQGDQNKLEYFDAKSKGIIAKVIK